MKGDFTSSHFQHYDTIFRWPELEKLACSGANKDLSDFAEYHTKIEELTIRGNFVCGDG